MEEQQENTPEVAPTPEPPAEAPAAPQQPEPAAQTEAPATSSPEGSDAVASPRPEGSDSQPAGDESKKGPSLSKIKKLQQSHEHRPKRRRGGGGGGGDKPAGEGQAAQGEGKQGERRPRPKKGGRPPRPPREKGPLPFDELRNAAKAIMQQHGDGPALKVAVAELAPKERNDISDLVSNDGDFRVRARSISAGSLAAGKLGKALAAQQIAIADVKDLWPLFLSKEEAAERQSWIRNAKRRDEERAKRQEERRNRTDRISKEDMEKARDGRVGAQIRFVIAGEKDPRDAEKSEKKKKDDAPKKKTTAADLLDRLGY